MDYPVGLVRGMVDQLDRFSSSPWTNWLVPFSSCPRFLLHLLSPSISLLFHSLTFDLLGLPTSPSLRPSFFFFRFLFILHQFFDRWSPPPHFHLFHPRTCFLRIDNEKDRGRGALSIRSRRIIKQNTKKKKRKWKQLFSCRTLVLPCIPQPMRFSKKRDRERTC